MKTMEQIKLTNAQKEELKQAAENWLKAKNLFDKHEKALNDAKAVILSILGDDVINLTIDDKLISNTISYSQRCSVSELKKGDFDIYQKYLYQSPNRSFKVLRLDSKVK